MNDLFTLLFYQPLFNLLIVIYNTLPTHDLGIAIILLTIIVKVALYPLFKKQTDAQHRLQELQPKIQELKERHKDDRQALAQAQMRLFSEHKMNPLSSCLPLLVQFPFLIALFYVFVNGLNEKSFELLYAFVQKPSVINDTFLGLVTLTQNHHIPLAALTALTQFWYMKISLPKKLKTEQKKEEDLSQMMSTQMLYMMPVVTGVMAYQFPAGLGLYWVAQTVLSVAQHYQFLAGKKA